MLRFLVVVSLFISFLTVSSIAQTEIDVPKGKSILPNGYFHQGEWKKANSKKISPETQMFVKQDKVYVYLAFKFLQKKHTGVDLYIRSGKSEGRMFHISAALGEKPFQAGKWQDWIWGKNKFWTGNVINLYSENGKRKIVEPDGFEFQISKETFKSKNWSLRLNLKRPELIIPQNSTAEDVSNWIKIKI